MENPATVQHSPFPSDGNWTRVEDWREYIEAMCAHEWGSHALGLLSFMFPARWISQLRWPDPEHVERWHPILMHYAMRYGRWALLELGRALWELPVARAKTRKRLQTPKEYITTLAELRTGLLLHLSGVKLEHEPLSNGGPDWLGTNGSGERVAVEVKCLEVGASSQIRQGATIELSRRFSELLSQNPPTKIERSHIELVIFDETIDELVESGPRLSYLADMLARRAEEALRREAEHGAFLGHVVGGVGEISFTPAVYGNEPIHVTTQGPHIRHSRSIGRIRDQLSRAASQLNKVSDVPGIVVLDMLQNHDLMAYAGDIREMLLEDALSAISAVVILPGRRTVLEAQRNAMVVTARDGGANAWYRFVGNGAD